MKIYKGDEVICPDGRGRISKIVTNRQCTVSAIEVETYYNNRSCLWDVENVQLIERSIVPLLPDFTTRGGTPS